MSKAAVEALRYMHGAKMLSRTQLIEAQIMGEISPGEYEMLIKEFGDKGFVLTVEHTRTIGNGL